MGEAVLAPPSRGVTRGVAGKASLPFMALKQQIMLGELEAGQVLTELDLASRFSCSQGTVREALLQLQEEGLVQRKGYRGTQVSACTTDEAVEMFHIRQAIETRGIRRAMRHPSRDLVPDLRALMRRMEEAAEGGDELELAALDRDFHRRLFAEAGLAALDPILHRCLVHNHRYKISRSLGPRDLRQTALRHEAIIAAIAQGDTEAAAAALRHHIATIVDLGPNIFPDSAP